MCGIVGIFHYAEPDRPIDRDLLARMTHAIAHRGPDGEGFYIKDNLGLRSPATLNCRSLPNRRPADVQRGRHLLDHYNGEFYNHASFRDRLSARGHRFPGPRPIRDSYSTSWRRLGPKRYPRRRASS